ncbi:MAG: Rab family GTPase [Promethearchaeota archaeon]
MLKKYKDENPMVEGQKFRFKVSVVGDSNVGKTTLMKKFTQGSFRQDYSKTRGAQFSTFDREINGDDVRLLFWDIAGRDDFHFLQPNFLSNSRAAIIVFSLEDTGEGKVSFNHILNWRNKIVENAGNIPLWLFANKVDLVDINELDDSRLKRLVEEHNFQGYYYTSVDEKENIMRAFNDISTTLYAEFKDKVE